MVKVHCVWKNSQWQSDLLLIKLIQSNFTWLKRYLKFVKTFKDPTVQCSNKANLKHHLFGKWHLVSTLQYSDSNWQLKVTHFSRKCTFEYFIRKEWRFHFLLAAVRITKVFSRIRPWQWNVHNIINSKILFDSVRSSRSGNLCLSVCLSLWLVT